MIRWTLLSSAGWGALKGLGLVLKKLITLHQITSQRFLLMHIFVLLGFKSNPSSALDSAISELQSLQFGTEFTVFLMRCSDFTS
jgi:hypothetical protein